jgi:multiple sugar transport system permease protein
VLSAESVGRERTAAARRGGWVTVALPALAYLGLTLGSAVMVAPFCWMLSTALKSPAEAFSYPPQWIPRTVTLENFERVWTAVPFGRYTFNSIFVAVSVMALELITASMAAYAFARLRFPGRDRLFLLYLATLMIPGQVTIIPNFILMRYMDWLDTYQGLIIPNAFTAFGTFLLRQAFLAMPGELEEAAKIDGCGYFGIYRRIILPLAGPALATLAILSFQGSYNAYFWPLVVVSSDEMWTLPLALRLFTGSAGLYATDWWLVMAGASIAVAPMLVIFVLAQKYFVRGIVLTGMGGR